MVVRPFDWRDLVLLHRTRHLGVCLDSRLALTRGPQAVQNALVDAFVPGNRGALTIVMRSNKPDEPSAIGQLLISDDRQQAHIAYISPSDALDERAGLQLLDGLARAAESAGCRCSWPRSANPIRISKRCAGQVLRSSPVNASGSSLKNRP